MDKITGKIKVKKAKNAFLNVSSKIYQNKPINNIFNIYSKF